LGGGKKDSLRLTTDECEGDDADGLKHAAFYYERSADAAFHVCWYSSPLEDDGRDDDEHADECESACFGQLH
jgi:hypothetical protein